MVIRIPALHHLLLQDVGQMTLWPQASVYLAINEDDDNNSTYLLECFVGVK